MSVLGSILYQQYLVSDVKGRAQSERVCENRALRGMFGPKRDEVTGGWRKLLNDKLRNEGRAIAHAVSRRIPTAKPGFEPGSGYV